MTPASANPVQWCKRMCPATDTLNQLAATCAEMHVICERLNRTPSSCGRELTSSAELPQKLQELSAKLEHLSALAEEAKLSQATDRLELNALRKHSGTLKGELARTQGVAADLIKACAELFRRASNLQVTGPDADVTDRQSAFSDAAGIRKLLGKLSFRFRSARNPGLVPPMKENRSTINAGESERQSLLKSVPVVSLVNGQNLLPLTPKTQRVRVSASHDIKGVWATASCANTSESVIIHLSLPELAQHARFEFGCAETHNGLENCFRIVAGERKQIGRLIASGVETALDLRRLSGPPCILNLELLASEVNQSSAFTTASAESLSHTAVPDVVAHGSQSHRGRVRSTTLWTAQELIRQGQTGEAVDFAFSNATDSERPAIHLLLAGAPNADDTTWLWHVNQYVKQFGVAPVNFSSTDAPRFLRLQAKAPRLVSEGPVVSVLMTAFNAQRTLEFAAKSILNQTWQPLELIIVDDCSEDDSWTIARQLAKADARIKVHRNPVKAGPYVSKNVALSISQGTYITCHDADDWAHPQRIEKQIEVMCVDGRAVRASVSGHVRMTATGIFNGLTKVGETSHDGALRLAHVSCMFESDFMRQYLGHWDSVRFAADGEMLERVTRILGAEFLKVRQLAIFSLDAMGSLTNDPLHGVSKLGGISPVRRLYRDNWRKWHAGVTLETAYLPFPQLQRCFDVPPECEVPKPLVDLVLESPPAPAVGRRTSLSTHVRIS